MEKRNSVYKLPLFTLLYLFKTLLFY